MCRYWGGGVVYVQSWWISLSWGSSSRSHVPDAQVSVARHRRVSNTGSASIYGSVRNILYVVHMYCDQYPIFSLHFKFVPCA